MRGRGERKETLKNIFRKKIFNKILKPVQYVKKKKLRRLKFLKRQNFTNFSKNAFSENCRTTDFENRKTSSRDHLAFVFLVLLPSRASSVHLTTGNFHPFCRDIG